MFRRAPLVAVLSVVIGLLAACGGGGDGDATAPMSPGAPSPSSSASSSRTTVAPRPDLTVAPPGETAEQFIRRWIELGNRMQTTGETEAYLDVAGPDCDTCREFARRIGDVYSAGGQSRGGEETILALKDEAPTQWVLRIRAAPAVYRERPGGPEKRLSGGEYRSRVYLAEVSGRWIVGATEELP